MTNLLVAIDDPTALQDDLAAARATVAVSALGPIRQDGWFVVQCFGPIRKVRGVIRRHKGTVVAEEEA